VSILVRGRTRKSRSSFSTPPMRWPSRVPSKTGGLVPQTP
jgi:hypothetical protein